jgi:hypothetical protein
MKLRFLLLLVAVMLLVSGCINYSEEMWLGANGAGKLTMELKVAESLLRLSPNSKSDPFSKEKLEEPFKDVKGIRVTETRSYTEGDSRVALIALTFDSPEALQNINQAEGTPPFLGIITLVKNDKEQLTFTRVINKSAGQSNNRSEFDRQMAAQLFSQYVWKYTIHFPGRVLEANTPKEKIKGDTVIWEKTMGEFMQSAEPLTATIQLPTLTSVLINIGLILAGLLALYILFIIVKKKLKKIFAKQEKTPEDTK